MDLFAVLAVVIVLLTSYYFRYIYRPQNDQDDPVVFRTSHESFKSTEVQSPFYIDLDHNKSSIDDSVVFRLVPNTNALRSSFNLIVLWSVDISKFYEFIDSISTEFYENFYKNDSFMRISSELGCKKVINIDQTPEEFNFTIPEETKRLHKESKDRVEHYQLVIVGYRSEDELQSLSQTDIVISFWVVHLKDSKMKTKIIYEYSKCLNGKVIRMNKLYAAESDCCVICRSEPSNQVLLPCKHVCTCRECLKMIKKECPMCRTQFNISFEI